MLAVRERHGEFPQVVCALLGRSHEEDGTEVTMAKRISEEALPIERCVSLELPSDGLIARA
jgi:hypothetical protein